MTNLGELLGSRRHESAIAILGGETGSGKKRALGHCANPTGCSRTACILMVFTSGLRETHVWTLRHHPAT